MGRVLKVEMAISPRLSKGQAVDKQANDDVVPLTHAVFWPRER